MVGVAFLDKVPNFAASNPSAKLYVEWAPGADLTGDTSGASWTWLDLSNDVLQANNQVINIGTIGRSDGSAQSQPASCTFMLDNRAGTYSRGPQSSSYPNVKLNIPVRISIALDGVYANRATRFQGYIWSMAPSWDSIGTYAVVNVQAAGVSRRLQHGLPSLDSSLFRAYQDDPLVVAYWPMEEAVGSAYFNQAFPGNGGSNMLFQGAPTLSSYNGVIGSGGLPAFTASSPIQATITHDFNQHFEVDFLLYAPSAPAADTAVLRFHTLGSDVTRWEVVLVGASTTNIKVNGYADNATISTTFNLNYGSSISGGVTVGQPLSCRFMVKQNGAATSYALVVFSADPALPLLGATGSGSVAATTCGDLTQITNLAAAGMNNIVLGHIAAIDDYNHTFVDGALFGWYSQDAATESPYERLSRLSTEQNVFMDSFTTNGTEVMGPQSIASYMTLMREAETVDGGMLWDGQNSGLRWRDLGNMTNNSAALTLAPTDLMPPFDAEDDDQNIVNKVTVSRKNGGSGTAQDTTGPLGITEIGTYEDSLSSVNVGADDRLQDFAGWQVLLGTVEGYRYPKIDIDLRKGSLPANADDWIFTFPGSRITITLIESYISQITPGNIDLMMVGYTEKISRFVWSATLNCVPYAPYAVGVYEDTGDTYDLTAARYEQTEGASTTGGVISVGTTSVSVATSAGNPLWSTSALDVPFKASIGGYPIDVTAISGSSSPQTFTITSSPYAISSGAAVQLWFPSYYML